VIQGPVSGPILFLSGMLDEIMGNGNVARTHVTTPF